MKFLILNWVYRYSGGIDKAEAATMDWRFVFSVLLDELHYLAWKLRQ